MKKYKLYWFFRKLYDKYLRIKDKTLIPYGMYCHKSTRHEVCPYWDVKYNEDEQKNGYCSFDAYGDWEEKQLSLLWDQCKQCAINEEKGEMFYCDRCKEMVNTFEIRKPYVSGLVYEMVEEYCEVCNTFIFRYLLEIRK